MAQPQGARRPPSSNPSRPLAANSPGESTASRSGQHSPPAAVGRTSSQNDLGLFEKPVDAVEAPVSPPSNNCAFEVNWDGDLMCPRSFGRARKWLVVFIVSHVSLCV